MAKKKSATSFNMTQTILALLTEQPNLTLKEASASITANHPDAAINEKSFGVAFYTARKKLGISSGVGRKKSSKKVAKKFVAKKSGSVTTSNIDFAAIQAAAKFVGEVGGTEAALEAIKQLQAVQVN